MGALWCPADSSAAHYPPTHIRIRVHAHTHETTLSTLTLSSLQLSFRDRDIGGRCREQLQKHNRWEEDEKINYENQYIYCHNDSLHWNTSALFILFKVYNSVTAAVTKDTGSLHTLFQVCQDCKYAHKKAEIRYTQLSLGVRRGRELGGRICTEKNRGRQEKKQEWQRSREETSWHKFDGFTVSKQCPYFLGLM